MGKIKLKIFAGEVDLENNLIRICPSCKANLFYEAAVQINSITKINWNNKILAILCCLCTNLLTRYIKNARDYDLEMEERRINRFVGYDAREYQCRILRGDLGLRKLGLIK